MIVRRIALVVVHLAIAAAILGGLVEQRRSREQAVAELRALADAERADTERMRRDHAVHKELRSGLREQDPYVVEYLARERLGWSRSGEITPPPASP